MSHCASSIFNDNIRFGRHRCVKYLLESLIIIINIFCTKGLHTRWHLYRYMYLRFVSNNTYTLRRNHEAWRYRCRIINTLQSFGTRIQEIIEMKFLRNEASYVRIYSHIFHLYLYEESPPFSRHYKLWHNLYTSVISMLYTKIRRKAYHKFAHLRRGVISHGNTNRLIISTCCQFTSASKSSMLIAGRKYSRTARHVVRSTR